ncbi:hypothetical protein P0R31_39460 [Bradyrhizobium yuanmingense]|uniref:hypothetical protein n=1 Tax=Bradyrhizobium yuanmingense TaxID=108015 RepID=UPI0023B9A0BA|nr:hypothetical protein [Bradyrhizobium yuanmingense]MDF0523274.1 hypothetical protein [Bradyrhizobium yuanmingense]
MPSETPLRKLFDAPFSFKARPEPIAGDLRMSWGISVLLLSLSYSRAKKASFQKLQFLAHSVRIAEGRDDVRALLRADLRPSDISVRVEPWLNRAISYAHALGLVSVDNGKVVSLTDKGIAVTGQIQQSGALVEEGAFLKEVASKITETLLRRIWRMEDLL